MVKTLYEVSQKEVKIIDSALALNLSVPISNKRLPEKLVDGESFGDGEVVKLLYDDEKVLVGAYVCQEGKLVGESKRFYPNGQLRVEEFYCLDQSGKSVLNGPSFFYGENGQILSESYFYNGKQVGRSVKYDREGNVVEESGYRDGLLEGVQKHYYSNGEVKSQMSYVEGVLEGKVILFYDNGSVKRSAHYHKGKPDGKDLLMSENGHRVYEREFEKGKLLSEKSWSDQEVLIEEISYHSNGQRDTRKWDLKGQMRFEEIFQGECYQHLEWDENGQLVKEYHGSVSANGLSIDDYIRGVVTEKESSICERKEFLPGNKIENRKVIACSE